MCCFLISYDETEWGESYKLDADEAEERFGENDLYNVITIGPAFFNAMDIISIVQMADGFRVFSRENL